MRPAPHPDGDSDWARRIVSGEINGRRINEAIERGQAGRDAATYICECGRLGCTAKVPLTVVEYERVRSDFDRFLVAPGHPVAGIDTVVEEHDGYFVTTKQGTGAEAAEATDPRGDQLDRG